MPSLAAMTEILVSSVSFLANSQVLARHMIMRRAKNKVITGIAEAILS